jgi:uncharacterized protein
MNVKLLRALVCIMLVLVLYSCATYNTSMTSYYNNIRAHNYEKAQHSLEKNKLIKKNRNTLLYNVEMGKLARLQNDYATSNNYFNTADAIIESSKKTIADVAVSNLVNPMMQAYRGEDHEQFMVHYYKALNYAALGLTDDAVVEARRITLSNYAQDNKYRNNNRYNQDAFALNLQGIIYEMASDYNNAFIAYRNAVELYQKNKDQYYGVKLPNQLLQDVMRMAIKMGFTSDYEQYKNNYNTDISIDSAATNSELILFIEEGQAPIKEENSILLTGTKNGIGSFNYIDANGLNANFNFNYGSYGMVGEKYTAIRSFKLSLPRYAIQYYQPQNITIALNNKQYNPTLAHDINNIAINVLKERYVTEIANALARQLTKKVVQRGAERIAESIAKNNNHNSNDTTEAQKQQRKIDNDKKAKRAGEATGFVVNMLNSATEKADTRNWQSLPAFVHYVRIPLTAGQNSITLQTNGQVKTISVQGRQGLQMVGVNLD